MRIAIIEPSGAVLNMLLYAVKLINEYDVQGFIHPPEDLTPYDCVVIEPGQYKRWLPAIYDHVQRRGKHAIILTQYYECMTTGLPTIRKQTVFIAPLLAKLEEIAQQINPIPM